MTSFVKNFFTISLLILTFALTGCASGRYHKSLEVPGALTPSPQGLAWPLSGPVLKHFGATEDGVTLKGMVLAAREGQDVRAAQSGVVAYTDESMRGYGRTLIVEHSGGLATVYARNAQILVLMGERVTKGQVIARSGSSGKGEAPQLYFEVRRDSRPIDPRQILV